MLEYKLREARISFYLPCLDCIHAKGFYPPFAPTLPHSSPEKVPTGGHYTSWLYSPWPVQSHDDLYQASP